MDERIPEALAAQLAAQYDAQTLARIEAGWRAERAVTFRINPLKTAPEAAEEALAGLQTDPVPWYAQARILRGAREEALQALPLYEAGGIYLQSLSSMLPPLLLDPKPGESILDMCAAPGGKTTELAALCGGTAMITACERDRLRAERLRFNLERQGARRVTVMNTDAARLDDGFRFDKILLDAPCTGSGTLSLAEGAPARRMTPAWIDKTVRIQEALLQKALKLLAPGGLLVYSTCSILGRENEEVVRGALKAADLLPVPEALAASLPCLPTRLPGTLCLCPDALYEGFFVAVLRRKGGR